jgi:NADPH:quinone reductase
MASIPKTTHAIQFFKNGGPEVLEFREVEVPTPEPDELLVKVEWAGVNFS